MESDPTVGDGGKSLLKRVQLQNQFARNDALDGWKWLSSLFALPLAFVFFASFVEDMLVKRVRAIC